ncbi:hypothetical protein Tco_1297232 [Tanacetum coccineum]
MKGLWRGVRPSFLLSNHERNWKYVDLYVDPKSARPQALAIFAYEWLPQRGVRNYQDPHFHRKNQHGKAFSVHLGEDSPRSSEQRGSQTLLDLQKDLQDTDSGTRAYLVVRTWVTYERGTLLEIKEDREGWPSSFLPKWAAKSGGRFISRLPFSSARAFEGPLPSIFLPILILSMFGVSSNPTTLSRYLRTLGDLVRSGGVTSLVRSGLGSISSSSS